jgi:hypothetical protein
MGSIIVNYEDQEEIVYTDYKDDDNEYSRTFRGQDDWGISNFTKRKQEMLQYFELELNEGKTLMEHTYLVHSTDVI